MSYIKKNNYEYFNLVDEEDIKSNLKNEVNEEAKQIDGEIKEIKNMDVNELNSLDGITASSGSAPANVGEKGPPGPKGLIGPPGPVGPPPGDEGPEGPEGPRGPQGPVGKVGNSGGKSDVMGQRGAIGIQGEIGPQGEKGIKGLTGRAGPPGDRGIRGPPADPPIDNTPIPPAGPKGPKGYVGDLGPIGNMGPQGPAGIRGEEGSMGSAGLQGNLGKDGRGASVIYGYASAEQKDEFRDCITPYLSFSANGNIGINNKNPERKLHVSPYNHDENSEYNILKLETNSGSVNLGVGNSTYVHFFADSNKKYYFNHNVEINGSLGAYPYRSDNNPSNTLRLKTNNTDRITVLSNGSVGIGKSPNTDSSLDVNGTLKATTLCVGNKCMDEVQLQKVYDYVSIPRESGCVPCKCNYNNGGYWGNYTSCGTLDDSNYWRYGPMTCHDPSFTNGILKFKAHGSCPGINSLTFTIDHKDQGWGNRCSYYGLHLNDGNKNFGANFQANRGNYKTSTHTVTYSDPKPIYKPGQCKIWLKAGGHWPGCAIYVKNTRNVKVTMSDGSVINVTNFPTGSYYTGRSRPKNHGEQASVTI